MTKFRKSILVGFIFASLGLAMSAAHANADECHRAGFNKEKFMQHMQQREAHLHQALQLSAAQEQAWKVFTDKVKPAAGERPKREEFAGLKAPERMERMAEHMQQREARMNERVAAVKEFYAVLTPEQQKIFDDNFMAHDKHAKHQGK